MNLIYTLVMLIVLYQNIISVTSEQNTDTNGSIITAPNAGLVVLYQGQYRPSNRIIFNTAMLPMTTETCYLLPIAAARKIPACNNFTSNIRHKRLIGDIISIGMSTIALGTATTSLVLTKSLQKKVNEFEGHLQTFSNRVELGEARMVQFDKNQIRLGLSLQQTEHLVNSTVDRVNQHSKMIEIQNNRLNEHQQLLASLQQRIIDNEQATANQFLHLAVHDIANNKPTLAFLHPSDMNSVVKSILQQNNISIPVTAEQLPIIELIMKLILRQQIEFIPAERYSNTSSIEIGKLMFTTFYALPNEQQSDFSIYKIITSPFIHHSKIVRLAQMPAYIGTNRKAKSSISWTNDDMASCIFHLVTTCRETPAEKALQYGNTCLEQVMTGKILKNCRTEHTSTNLPYIQQLQNGRWLISTNTTSLHCIKTQIEERLTKEATVWNDNTQITIPPMAIITVNNGTTIQCPGFNLPGPAIPETRSTINIIRNSSTVEEHNDIIDIHKEISSNTTWEKLPYLNDEIDQLLQEMSLQQASTTQQSNIIQWHNQHSGKLMICLVIVTAALIVVSALIILYLKQSANNKITIALP
uniref:Envelope fusion glycoprotein n=1 Tax=Adineta vaga TaxID=104782 RepID=A0A1W6BQZ4_ADIVA|nr:envelope fusion glycoprotein [Adineta vaga]